MLLLIAALLFLWSQVFVIAVLFTVVPANHFITFSSTLNSFVDFFLVDFFLLVAEWHFC